MGDCTLFKDEKNAFSYVMIEGTGEYPSGTIQQAAKNASLESGTSDLEIKIQELTKEER